MVEHPAYDGFWQSQALDKLIVQKPLTVPTMWEQGLYGTRKICGGRSTSYRALAPKGYDRDDELPGDGAVVS